MHHSYRMTDSDILTSPEAGLILNKSARTVQRLADRGELEYVRKLPGPNGAYIFTRGAIEKAANDPALSTSSRNDSL